MKRCRIPRWKPCHVIGGGRAGCHRIIGGGFCGLPESAPCHEAREKSAP